MASVLDLHNNPIIQIARSNPVVKTIRGQDVGEGKIENVAQAANGLQTILKKILGPILTIIGVAAVIYAVYLGVMYAKAESAEKRKEIQGRLIGACIGAVIIIAGATICFAVNWDKVYHAFAGIKYLEDTTKGGCQYCNNGTKHLEA